MTGPVWITGAGKGIGRALALRLARDGGTVAVSARTDADLRTLVEEATAKALPGRLVPFPLDVTDARAVRDAVAAIEATLGPLSTAVLNAGTHQPMPLAAFDSAVVRRIMDVNVMGTSHCLDALLPGMRRRRSGHIAVVASVAGYRGLPTSAAYSASKAALIAMLESLRPEADRDGVVLQVINPGFVRTPLTDRNTFPMPFLMEPGAAADRIAAGLRHQRFEVTFPRRFTWLVKAARLLPYRLYFPLMQRILGP